MSAINIDTFKSSVYRKYIDRYKQDNFFEINSDIPMIIIQYYLESDAALKVPEKIYMNFKAKYILSENELEGVPVSKTEVKCLVHDNPIKHTKEEVLGLADVYEYINNFPIEKINDLTIYKLLNIHSILFSYTPYPQFAGRFRNSAARIIGSRVELVEYCDIPTKMNEVYYEFKTVLEKINNLEEFIRCAIRLHAKLIEIHPFSDGNGRCTRAFFNLLMKYVGLPPTYVKLEEKEKYCAALESAILEYNTKKLEQFFLFKIANAIIENDEEFSGEAIKIL